MTLIAVDLVVLVVTEQRLLGHNSSSLLPYVGRLGSVPRLVGQEYGLVPASKKIPPVSALRWFTT